jgi:putative heme transporter
MARERNEGGAHQVTVQEPSGTTRQVVPTWLINAAGIAWRVIAAVALAAVAAYIAGQLFVVTASILLAAIISATFAPFVLSLRNRGRSRTASAAIVTVAAVLVVLAVLTLITLALAPYVPDVVGRVQEGIASARQYLADASVPQSSIEAAENAAAEIEKAIEQAVGVIAGHLATAATVGLLALFLTFFFLQDGDKAWGWAFQATTGNARDRIGSAGHDALERLPARNGDPGLDQGDQ